MKRVIKIFFNSFLRFLSFVGVSKDIIGQLQFYLSLYNGMLLPFFGKEANERATEYLWLLRNLKKAKAKILDVGCSGSTLSYELLRRGFDVYGIDFRAYPDRPKNLRFYRQDILSLPFEDNFFDLVIVISTFEHIGLGGFGDPIYEDGDLKAIEELERVLKNGGEILPSVPFSNIYTVTWQRFYDRERLLRLSKRLLIAKEEFYIRNRNKWVKSSLEEAKKLSFNNRANAVACLILRKAD